MARVKRRLRQNGITRNGRVLTVAVSALLLAARRQEDEAVAVVVGRLGEFLVQNEVDLILHFRNNSGVHGDPSGMSMGLCTRVAPSPPIRRFPIATNFART